MLLLKRSVLALSLLGVSLSPSGPAMAAEVTESRAIPAFHAVDVSGSLRLVIRPEGPKGIVLKGDKAALKRIVTEVKGGTLYLRQESDQKNSLNPWTWIKQTELRVTCEVGAAAIDSIGLSGASSAEASGLAADRFNLEVSGASTAKLQGSARHLVIDLSGASKVDAARLISDRAELDLSGASHAVVNARKTLEVSASGASDVRYVGKPDVEQDVSGAASVRPL